jgi:DNA (cytosine-5)-methyltransferase 1
MKLITLFSGIGMQEEGLKRAKLDYELINYCEYSSIISKCFSLYHNEPETKNIGDITKLDIKNYHKELQNKGNGDIDLVISSFPCKSFSLAGHQKGFDDPKYGGLFDKSHEFIKQIKPNVVVFENVKSITSPRYKAVEYIREQMEKIGYTCYDQVLNSQDYNIPQNRTRWFMICVKKTFSTKEFIFPNKIPLKKTMEKDIIDYSFKGERMINKDMKECFVEENLNLNKEPTRSGIITLLDALKEGYVKSGFLCSKVYSTKGICPTITCSNHLHLYGKGVKGKLIPLERWRLMGLPENKFKLLKDNDVSDRQINIITGNGIVVDVFYHVSKQLKKIYFK